MARKGLLGKAVPRLKQYLTEHGKPITSGETADFLGVTMSTAYNVLLYMEAVDILSSVKSGHKNLYFLKGAYNDSQIAMLSRARVQRTPKRSKRATPVERTADNIAMEKTMVVHDPNVPGDMLPALAILGIYQTDLKEPETQPQESKQIKFKKNEVSTPLFITTKRHGQIKSLPKEARLLSMGDTTRLKKKYLRGLDGFDDVERFDCFFAEASALERGEYGNTFYASGGTSPWQKVYKVTVERRTEQ